MELMMVIQITVTTALCAVGSEGYNPQSYSKRSDALTPAGLDRLIDVYGLKPTPIGPQLKNNIWRSEETLSSGHHLANAVIMVLNNVCIPWTTFPNDRFFHIHEGSAIIDIINPHGSHCSVCLGSTVKDPNCKYVVKIPRNSFATIRPKKALAILTGVLTGGNLLGGRRVSLPEMYERFGGKNAALINRASRCYPNDRSLAHHKA